MRRPATLVAALACGAALSVGMAACGSDDEPLEPVTAPPLTIPQGDTGLTEPPRTTETTDTTDTTLDDDLGGGTPAPAPAPGGGGGGAPAPAPAPAPSPSPTPQGPPSGGGTPPGGGTPAPAPDNSGGGSFGQFCQQNPGAQGC